MKAEPLLAITLLCVFTAFGIAAGQPQVPVDPPPPSAPPSLAAQLAAADPEASNMPQRDPFWPIGYMPAVEHAAPIAIPQPVGLKWPTLKLKGLTKTASGEYMAIIEGMGVVEAGETVSVKQQNHIFQWKINTITEQGLSSTRLKIETPQKHPRKKPPNQD